MKKTVYTTAALALLVAPILAQTAFAADGGTYTSNGKVEFVPDEGTTDPVDPTDPTTPVTPTDPTDPTKPVNPGTNGPLSIDFASSLDFGKQIISTKDQTYSATSQEIIKADASKDNVPNYVQVTDKRGSNAGWKLTVKQEGQFQNATATNKVLAGAEVTLKLPTTDSPSKVIAATAGKIVNNVTSQEITLAIGSDGVAAGAASDVMSAAENNGAGTWVDYFGTKAALTDETKTISKVEVKRNVNPAVQLKVPGATVKDAVAYSTTLTWALADTPS